MFLMVAIQIGEVDRKSARNGDRVSISLVELDVVQIGLGTVLCDPKIKVPVVTKLRARITTFDLTIPLTIGVPVVFHHLGTSEPAFITGLESSIKGGVEKKRPRVVGGGCTAVVVITLERGVCCLVCDGAFGRFLLRRGDTSIAAGVILELL